MTMIKIPLNKKNKNIRNCKNNNKRRKTKTLLQNVQKQKLGVEGEVNRNPALLNSSMNKN